KIVRTIGIARARFKIGMMNLGYNIAGWFTSSGWRLCRPERAHGWSPCGILQRSAWSPARHQNRPRSEAHLGTLHSFAQLRQNRQNQLLFEVPLSVFVMAGTAGAADLPVAPPPPSAFNWSGCYLGGFVGGARSDGDMTFTDLGNAQFRSYSGGMVAGRLEDQHSWNIG